MKLNAKIHALEQHPDFIAYVIIAVSLLITGIYQFGKFTGHMVYYFLQK